MRRKKLVPEVNAGSMADIAFLLLIFFLVTAAIPKDYGIQRKLPKPCPPEIDCSGEVYERNILRVSINGNNSIMVENDVIEISDLKDLAKNFIDNNGDGTCSYCSGSKYNTASDSPKKAVISLQNDKLTNYGTFISVQDELTKAYFELRDSYSKNVLKKPSNELTKAEINKLKEAYPFILSEAETK